ncbi:MAG: IS110 family transposase [Candidatus Hadarchaeota archaeon]
MTKYVGLDVHKRTCHATVMDENGAIIRQEKFLNRTEELDRFFEGMRGAKVAMEAGYCWQPAYYRLEGMGHEVKLAHPFKTRIIAEAKIKTDASDSEALAQLLRLDWLPTSYVPPDGIRELRELVRLHVYLTRERTRFKNKIRSEMNKRGIEIAGDPFTKRRRPLLRGMEVKAIDSYLEIEVSLYERIKVLERELKLRAQENEDARLLMTIPGVGYFSALAILAEIGDIDRFPNAEKLCSYVGLVPSLHQSGATVRLGRITKQGSAMLRWVLVECSWMHIRNARDTQLKLFFHRISKRKGRAIAITATARKLLVAVYWMLKRREEFRN